MEHLNKGNSHFADEEYEQALECYNQACQQDPKSFESFFRRSQCYYNLSKLKSAVADINVAIEIEPNNVKAYLKKGQYCFEMEDYENSLVAFEKVQSLDANNTQCKTWIRKSKAEIEEKNKRLEQEKAKQKASTPAPAPTPAPTAATTTSTTTPTPASDQPKLPIPSSGTKVKHEWYQTNTHVTITIFAKFVTDKNSKVDVKDKSIIVSFMMATGSEYLFDIELFDPVESKETNIKYYNTKIEVILKKSRAIKWDNLEYTGKEGPVSTMEAPTSVPSSVISPYASKKDWSKVDLDVDKEGDPLNRVFQDIFSKGSEEQQRAMMKSYVESGGTVLSTNWDDVKKKKVKGAPPKGMEMHDWSDGSVVTDLKKEDEDW